MQNKSLLDDMSLDEMGLHQDELDKINTHFFYASHCSRELIIQQLTLRLKKATFQEDFPTGHYEKTLRVIARFLYQFNFDRVNCLKALDRLEAECRAHAQRSIGKGKPLHLVDRIQLVRAGARLLVPLSREAHLRPLGWDNCLSSVLLNALQQVGFNHTLPPLLQAQNLHPIPRFMCVVREEHAREVLHSHQLFFDPDFPADTDTYLHGKLSHLIQQYLMIDWQKANLIDMEGLSLAELLEAETIPILNRSHTLWDLMREAKDLGQVFFKPYMKTSADERGLTIPGHIHSFIFLHHRRYPVLTTLLTRQQANLSLSTRDNPSLPESPAQLLENQEQDLGCYRMAKVGNLSRFPRMNQAYIEHPQNTHVFWKINNNPISQAIKRRVALTQKPYQSLAEAQGGFAAILVFHKIETGCALNKNDRDLLADPIGYQEKYPLMFDNVTLASITSFALKQGISPSHTEESPWARL